MLKKKSPFEGDFFNGLKCQMSRGLVPDISSGASEGMKM